MKFFDAFSGIGGFHLGIKQAHSDWECTGASEIDKQAATLYKRHFNEVENYGDIRKIERLPDGTDLLCGGFPCQSFSLAGKQGGFADTRGTLFFELARLAEASRPEMLFFENVKNLLYHDGGQTFKTIIQALGDLGYFVEWRLLNSKDFGVPQNRERVFIIGHLGGKPGCQIFPIGEGAGVPDEAHEKPEHLFSTLTATDYKGVSKQRDNVVAVAWRTRAYKGQPARLEARTDAMSNALNHAWKDWMVLTRARSEEGKEARREAAKTGIDHTPFQAKVILLKEDGIANCLTANQSAEHLLSNGYQVRRLTPLECERLQGFPDGWTEGQPDSTRYKQLGNAVTVPVVKAVAELLKNGNSTTTSHNVELTSKN